MCGCLQLAADPDSNVRSGSELLDRLLKVCLLLLYYKYQIHQVFWGRMQNTVLAATSKLKSSYVDVVFTSVCITTS